MSLKRKLIRRAAETAIRTAVDGAAVVEADSGYPVETTPTIRVGWSEDAPDANPMDGGLVCALGLMIEVHHALGPSALNAADDLQETIDAAVAALKVDADLTIVEISPPQATVRQEGEGEQNHLHLEIEYPVLYMR